MEKKFLFKIGVTTDITLEQIYGKETANISEPKVGNTIRFKSIEGERPTKYQNKIYRVEMVNTDYISTNNGNIQEVCTVKLTKINSPLNVLLKYKTK